MMIRKLLSLAFIFVGTCVGWVLLGMTVEKRTDEQGAKLAEAVGRLWGGPHAQRAPTVSATPVEGEGVHPIPLEGTDGSVDLKLEHRKKGLLWYATYAVDFDVVYTIQNPLQEKARVRFLFPLPDPEGMYDEIQLSVGDRIVPDVPIREGCISRDVPLEPGESEMIRIAYESRGMNRWRYVFGGNLTHVKNFQLRVTTNFDDVDFLTGTLSPEGNIPSEDGRALAWNHKSMFSSASLGIDMPRKLNPGPWVQQVTYYAPVSLFLFFFLLFVIATFKKIDLHPMHYFFVGCAYFSYHLLLAYLVDHVSIHVAFWTCSAVSIFLVVSYVRLVVGPKFAFFAVGLSQFVYLTLFSYTFFFEKANGLAITLLCIATLFIVMQSTAKVDWGRLLSREASPTPTS